MHVFKIASIPYLSNLVIPNVILTPSVFSPTQMYYTAVFNNNVTQLVINTTAFSSTTTVTIQNEVTGGSMLVNLANVFRIIIEVNPQDGLTTSSYAISLISISIIIFNYIIKF